MSLTTVGAVVLIGAGGVFLVLGINTVAGWALLVLGFLLFSV